MINATSNIYKQHNVLQIPYKMANPGDCGIGCIAMILEFLNIKSPSVADLSQEYKKEGFYIENIGWKHDGLVSILRQFSVNAHRAEAQNIYNIVDDNIKIGKPVIVSLRVPEINNLSEEGTYLPKDKSLSSTGHLCLVVGVQTDCLLLHDPRNINKYRDYLLISMAEFEKVFTGRCIYLD